MRGFFRMDYAREGGAGGTIVFTDGAVAGWDTGGAFFRGAYRESGVAIEGELTMDFPNGGISVTGEKRAKSAAPLILPFRIENAVHVEEMSLSAPQGAIVVKLTRVSSL